MCEFCESLIDNRKEVIWNVRSTYADHNICEYINDNNCGACNRCEMEFILKGYKYNEDIYVSAEYNQVVFDNEGNEVVVRPFTEGMQWNFCPVCGKQVSKNIKTFDKYYHNQIEIRDIEE